MTIRIIELVNPETPNPLNPLSFPLRQHLLSELESAFSSASTTAVILTCSTNFSVGADITEFGSHRSTDTPLTKVIDFIACSKIPVIAAMKGFALGGGLEVALACDLRVAEPKCKMGLPEVKIGIFPGARGTQRLPRVTNLDFALDMITSGRMVGVKEALSAGLINGVTKQGESLKECATRWAAWAELIGNSRFKVERMRVAKIPDVFFAKWRNKFPRKEKGGEAVQTAISAVQASSMPYDEGCQMETQLFIELLTTSMQGFGVRHIFFSERKVQGKSVGMRGISNGGVKLNEESAFNTKNATVGVIGAGTMGSGIAMSLILAGYKQVILVDNNEKSLARGMNNLSSILNSKVKKKKMTKKQAESMLAPPRLLTSLHMRDLKSCGLVIEAVFENLKIKQDIMQNLDSILPDNSVIASNTSTLDMDAIFERVRDKSRCIGMHFFSPAHVMPLVEIVTSKHSSDQAIGIMKKVTKNLKKVGVVVGNCDGFVGNRMIAPYSSESVFLLEDGCKVEQVDKALFDFGFKLGPFQMGDLAGNDIGYLIRKEKGVSKDPKTGAPGVNRPKRYSDIGDDMVLKLNRLGQKTQKGWYDYDTSKGKGRLPIPSPEFEHFLSAYRKTPSISITSEDIVQRVLFPLVNEGFKILEEGIVNDPSHIDIVYIYGYGWPAWRGGPMFWADNDVGLDKLLAKLEEFNSKYKGTDIFNPSVLLKKCVSLDIGVQEYFDKGMDKGSNARL